jgi:hypothetical protein
MKRFIIIFICVSALSCTRIEYIQTGQNFSPLPGNAEIAVFTTSKPDQKYQVVGLLRVRGGNLEKRIIRAKDYAKTRGGTAIIARAVGVITEPGTENVIEKIGTSTYETQEFVIIRYLSGKYAVKNEKLEEAKDDKIAAALPKKASIYDYNTLPRATYVQLIKEYQKIKDKPFRGRLYPKKIYKIPAALKSSVQSGDRIVSMTTKSGNNRILMIISMKDVGEFRNAIKAGGSIDFVYSPITVYNSSEGTQPVINFIESVAEIKK